MGEYGAFKWAYPSLQMRLLGCKAGQIQSCAYNFKGWLLWTWDTDEQPELWNGQSSGGAINLKLAPHQGRTMFSLTTVEDKTRGTIAELYSTTPSVHWCVSARPRARNAGRHRQGQRRPIRISSSRYGKTRILIFPSSSLQSLSTKGPSAPRQSRGAGSASPGAVSGR